MSGTTLAGLGQSRRRAPAPGQNTVVLNVSSVRGPFGDISSRLSIIRRILQSCSQSRSRPCDFVCDAQRWRPRPADRQRPRASSIFMWVGYRISSRGVASDSALAITAHAAWPLRGYLFDAGPRALAFTMKAGAALPNLRRAQPRVGMLTRHMVGSFIVLFTSTGVLITVAAAAAEAPPPILLALPLQLPVLSLARRGGWVHRAAHPHRRAHHGRRRRC